MAQTIRGVPKKNIIPRGPFVLVRQYDTTKMGELILPDIAKVVVQVAVKVGPEVKDIQEGDICILQDRSSITGVPEAKDGPLFLIPEGAIVGVIRGFDWRAQALEEARKPLLVS